jgi:hypothetical protein
VTDGAIEEANRLGQARFGPVRLAPVDPHGLAGLEATRGEPAPGYLDQAQIALLEGAVNESAGVEHCLHERTVEKHTVVKLAGHEFDAVQMYVLEVRVGVVRL